MLTTTSPRISHHGWQIQIVPFEQDFCFECYAPDMSDFMNDAEVYSDWETAFVAARQFVDREIAIQSLIALVNDWLAAGLISEDEYWNLTSFD
ncbi:MAG TPA: hypothetical protein V6D07_18345 [Trichocoleus sp.]